jgi:hypothetical protein
MVTKCVFSQVQLRLVKQVDTNSEEQNQMAVLINESNAQFAVRIKK